MFYIEPLTENYKICKIKFLFSKFLHIKKNQSKREQTKSVLFFILTYRAAGKEKFTKTPNKNENLRMDRKIKIQKINNLFVHKIFIQNMHL